MLASILMSKNTVNGLGFFPFLSWESCLLGLTGFQRNPFFSGHVVIFDTMLTIYPIGGDPSLVVFFLKTSSLYVIVGIFLLSFVFRGKCANHVRRGTRFFFTDLKGHHGRSGHLSHHRPSRPPVVSSSRPTLSHGIVVLRVSHPIPRTATMIPKQISWPPSPQVAPLVSADGPYD